MDIRPQQTLCKTLLLLLLPLLLLLLLCIIYILIYTYIYIIYIYRGMGIRPRQTLRKKLSGPQGRYQPTRESDVYIRFPPFNFNFNFYYVRALQNDSRERASPNGSSVFFLYIFTFFLCCFLFVDY